MFYLGGVAISIFLFLLLLSKKGKTLADKILTAWLLIMTVHLLQYYFYSHSLFPELIGLGIPLPLLHGPFLFLYTSALTKGRLSIGFSLLHFLPPLGFALYAIPFIALPVEEKLYIVEHNGIGYEAYNQLLLIAIYISGVLYIILSAVALRRHRKSIINEFSNTDKINLMWLQYLIYWIALVWILVFFTNDDWIFAATVLFIVFIGFYGIKQVGIFISPENGGYNPGTSNGVQGNSSEKKKYQKSGLNLKDSELIHQELSQLMSNEKLFRQSELSLTDLAQQLKAPTNYLSQVINEREGKNFYDYINTLRIEEFKRLASQPGSRRFTLMGLAEECGFNSKSSFNRYFKKATGKSPSEFMQTKTG